MEFEFNPETEMNELIFLYCKEVKSNKLCLICHLDERTTIDKNTNWSRYKLKCKHVYHSRCFRKWSFVKKAYNCPLCGDVNPL